MTGYLLQDDEEYYYIYRQQMGSLTPDRARDLRQRGRLSVRGHQEARTDPCRQGGGPGRHIDYLDANDEPVFYTYRHSTEISALVAKLAEGAPEYDFTTDDGVEHTLWIVRDRESIDRLTGLFAPIAPLYVADGHHRSAAASRVRELRRAANPRHDGSEEYNSFLTVIFPDDEMTIMPYNRVVDDLNGLSAGEFLVRMVELFEVTPWPGAASRTGGTVSGCTWKGSWYELTPPSRFLR